MEAEGLPSVPVMLEPVSSQGRAVKVFQRRATAAAAGPLERFLLALRADVGDYDAFFKTERFLELDNGLLELLLAQIEVGHDLMEVQEVILGSFDRRKHVEGFVDHFQPVVELAEIELQNRILRVLLQCILIYPDDFTRARPDPKRVLPADGG